MFEAAGWHVITVKYGRELTELFERDGGEALRRRIDQMTNEEYQRMLRASAAELRERLPEGGDGAALRGLIAELEDEQLMRAIRDLGGHDLGMLLDAFARGRRGDRSPVGDLRVHDQGVAAGDRGPPGQPFGVARRRAVARAGGRAGGGRGRSVGAV